MTTHWASTPAPRAYAKRVRPEEGEEGEEGAEEGETEEETEKEVSEE